MIAQNRPAAQAPRRRFDVAMFLGCPRRRPATIVAFPKPATCEKCDDQGQVFVFEPCDIKGSLVDVSGRLEYCRCPKGVAALDAYIAGACAGEPAEYSEPLTVAGILAAADDLDPCAIW